MDVADASYQLTRLILHISWHEIEHSEASIHDIYYLKSIANSFRFFQSDDGKKNILSGWNLEGIE